jgi:hypothetical protein
MKINDCPLIYWRQAEQKAKTEPLPLGAAVGATE